MVQHFVDGDGQGVLMPQHHHAERIADKYQVHAGFIKQARSRIVVRRQASDFLKVGMGTRSLGFALQEIGHGNFSVPGIRDDAHGGLRCHSLPVLIGGRSAANGIQPCTSPLRSITNFDAQNYKFRCAAIPISFATAPALGPSTGRRGRPSSASRKGTSHSRRKPLPLAVSKPRLSTNCKTARSQETLRSLEQWPYPQGARLRPRKRKKESTPRDRPQTT